MIEYKIGYKKKQWKHCPHDFEVQTWTSKDRAKIRRAQLQEIGLVQVIIKQIKG